MNFPAPSWTRRALCLGTFLVFTATGTAAPLRTTEHLMRHPFLGDRTLPCLHLEGKLLPLMPPYESKFTGSGDSLTLIWPGGRATARFRGATAKEAALLSADDWNKLTPAVTEAWGHASAAGVAQGIENLTPAKAELDVMLVNHWRTGLVSQDYTLGGQSFSHLLLLCRCADGFVFAVTLEAPAADLADCRQTLVGMIGAPILVREDELGS